MPRPLLPTRIATLIAVVAGGMGQPLAAGSRHPPPPAPLAVPHDENSYRWALSGLWNYQSCGANANAAAYAGLAAQLHSIEAAARAKGLGPAIDRVRRQYEELLRISLLASCGGGAAGALAGARRGIAAFQAWVAGAAPVTPTPAEREAEIARTIALLEEAYAADDIARGEAALRPFLDEHYVPPPRPDGTRADRIATLTALLRTTIYHETVAERHVAVNGDAATVTGILVLTYAAPAEDAPSEPHVARFRFTESYRSSNGIWRLAARQVSDRPLP